MSKISWKHLLAETTHQMNIIIKRDIVFFPANYKFQVFKNAKAE